MHSAISSSERPRKLLEITQEFDLGGRYVYVSPWLSNHVVVPPMTLTASAATAAGVGHLGLPEEAAALRAAVHISRLRGGLTPCRMSKYISCLVVDHSVGAEHRTTKYTTTRRADCSHGNSRVRGAGMCANTPIYGTCRPLGLRRTGASLSDIRASPFSPRRVVKRGRQFQGARSASVRSMSIGCDLPNA